MPCLLDIPLVGTPPVGHPFPGFIVDPMQKSGTALPAAHLVIFARSRPLSISKKSRLGVNTALYRLRRTCPHWHWRPGPAPKHKGRNLPVPLPVQPRPMLILTMVQWQEPREDPGIRMVRAVPTTVGPHPTWTHPERMWSTLIWSQHLEIVSLAQTHMR